MSDAILKKVAVLAGIIGTSLATSFYLYLRANSNNISRDLGLLINLGRCRKALISFIQEGNTVADIFEATAKNNPNGTAIQFVEPNQPTRRLTFAELDKASSQVASWARSEGVQPGNVVALMMENKPEFLITWLGLAKIGAIISLINFNLKGKPLVHSFSVCKAQIFIVGVEQLERAMEAREVPELRTVGKWFSYGGPHQDFLHLDPLLAAQNPNYDRSLRRVRGANDDIIYIYTSGTTGMPKAAAITSARFYMTGLIFSKIMGVRTDDSIYCALPLYHSAGGMIGVGLSWVLGIPITFRRKFSASSFWADAAIHNCTVIQYIGELCRYLLLSPSTPYDTAHSVRMAVGNGLRPDIWKNFQTRFNIATIGEFYAATEANVGLFNNLNKIGAVGFITPLIKRWYPVKIIKFNIEKEEPVRGADGFCIEAKTGESGEMLGQIVDGDPTRYFRGYTDPKATEKKLIRDVFVKGDVWFRTGDLLRSDSEGFVYFVDRIGDTFRWKGENVSTNEVAEVISSSPGVQEVNVYGVHVPRHEGRAGMAQIIASSEFSLEKLYSHVHHNLPSYAAPLFLRIGKEIEITSTFKHKKVDLVNEGFNPDVVKDDDLYLRDDQQKKYIPLDKALYHKVISKASL
eukprot:TRINITY_DN1788_c0_g1_i1.p1 TRINITY_DN1788_c0_g1~~TRINITY_DN1788_c0_g1_i1.p1  ORF type:complete len:631 (+),score=216.09 TRINITY_DN1788_c0_g1_i1:78-1970(+)